MASLVHLVRHAEVANPAGVVYGRLAGFGLSEGERSKPGSPRCGSAADR